MSIKSSQLVALKSLLYSIWLGVFCAIAWMFIPFDQGLDMHIKLAYIIMLMVVYWLPALISFIYRIIVKYGEIKGATHDK